MRKTLSIFITLILVFASVCTVCAKQSFSDISKNSMLSATQGNEGESLGGEQGEGTGSGEQSQSGEGTGSGEQSQSGEGTGSGEQSQSGETPESGEQGQEGEGQQSQTGEGTGSGEQGQQSQTGEEGQQGENPENPQESEEPEEPRDPNTVYELPCTITDEKTGLSFILSEGTFEIGTKITVQISGKVRLTEDEEVNMLLDPPEVVHTALKEKSLEYNVYEITAVLDDETVQPKNSVQVIFPFVEESGRNVAVYYVDENGARENLPLIIDTSEKTATATLNHFSWYVVANLDKTSEIANMPIQPNVLYAVIIALGVLVIGFAALAIFKKPKDNFRI